MKTPLILTIDQGGQSTRVALFNRAGEQLISYSAPCATRHISQGEQVFIEQDAEEILRGIQEGLQHLAAVLDLERYAVTVAGFAGQGSSFLCWDKFTGESLSPVLSWQDIRGEGYLQSPSMSVQDVQALTGLRFSPHYGASKMRWCLEHLPAVAQAATEARLCMGPIASFVFHRLCVHPPGATTWVDPGHAQRTLLWNLTNRQWEPSLLSLFQIQPSWLPHCGAHNSHFGDLLFGPYHVPVQACARDQGASLFVRGRPDSQACYVNMGTGAFVQRVSEKLVPPPGVLVSPLWLSQFAGEQPVYAWEAPVNGAAAAIYFVEAAAGITVTPEIVEQALLLAADPSRYFLNAVGGLAAPYWRTDLESQFSAELTALEKVAAWLESIIFLIANNIQLVRSADTEHIFISGGFSQADGLCQKLADISQLPVVRCDNADATLQGIACMAAGLPDTWRIALDEQVFFPQPDPALQACYENWLGVMQCWLQVK